MNCQHTDFKITEVLVLLNGVWYYTGNNKIIVWSSGNSSWKAKDETDWEMLCSNSFSLENYCIISCLSKSYSSADFKGN